MFRAMAMAGVAAVAPVVVGCGSPGGKSLGTMAAVKGKVTLDGASMASGEIGFGLPESRSS